MFGLGLRTYRRKIQRLSESSTERGRSLWEAVLDYVRKHELSTRREILTRFSSDEEAQVRAVLRDLRESELIFSSGSGPNPAYRAATDEELRILQRKRGSEGTDELLIALMYRDGLLTLKEIAERAQLEIGAIEPTVARLLESGRIERVEEEGVFRYRARALVIPLGAPVGWEAAVFDHFNALVSTVLTRLGAPAASAPHDKVGGSTYTIDVWEGHPLADEVTGTLARLRTTLSELRARVSDYNTSNELPESHTRVVIYCGQCLIVEGNDRGD
jgi:DNA-binding MarR family transcriptional regulator